MPDLVAVGGFFPLTKLGWLNRSFSGGARVWGLACHRLRQPGNNVHCFYGDELENFDSCCRRLMKRIKTIIPDGCPRARIRATSRVTRRLEDGGTLGDTLGDEARGMVVVGEHFLAPLPLATLVRYCLQNGLPPVAPRFEQTRTAVQISTDTRRSTRT